MFGSLGVKNVNDYVVNNVSGFLKTKINSL